MNARGGRADRWGRPSSTAAAAALPHHHRTGRLNLLVRALRPVGWIDARITAPGTSRRLALVRTGLAVVIGLRIATRDWAVLARQPPELFSPVGVVRLIPSMPEAWVLWTLRGVGTVAALAVVGRRFPRIALAVAWTCLLVLAGLWGSAGKILHNDVLLLLATVPVLLAPADAGPSDRTTSRAWGWAPRASLAVVGLVYFLTGYQKLHHSGLSWVTSDNMRWVLYQGALSPRSPYPGLSRALANQGWLSHLVAGSALAIELSAPLVLALRPTRRLFLVAAAVLHGMIWLTLGLDYWGWILTVAAVTLPSPVAGPAVRTSWEWLRPRHRPLVPTATG